MKNNHEFTNLSGKSPEFIEAYNLGRADGYQASIEDKKYNGWTNYETWRVKLELIDTDIYQKEILENFESPDIYDVSKWLRDSVLELIDIQCNSIASDYAFSFVENVNWSEIAEHLLDGLEFPNENPFL